MASGSFHWCLAPALVSAPRHILGGSLSSFPGQGGRLEVKTSTSDPSAGGTPAERAEGPGFSRGEWFSVLVLWLVHI